MNKKILLTAVGLISLTVAFTPLRPADAVVCGIPCLLQMGGQQVHDAGTRLKAILGSIQQQAMAWLEDANAWLSKYTGLAWSNKTEATKNTSTAMEPLRAPNLAKEKGLSGRTGQTGVAFQKRNDKGEMVTVDPPKATEKIEVQAEKMQESLLTTRGSMKGILEEQARKDYTAQQDAIEALAISLTMKDSFKELKKLGDELDELKASIVPNQPVSSEPVTGTSAAAAQPTATGGKDRSITTALRDNLRVRLLWDSLLTMQQQVMAVRLKTETRQAMRQLSDVAKMSEIEEVKQTDDK